jgi:hypothetical protein
MRRRIHVYVYACIACAGDVPCIFVIRAREGSVPIPFADADAFLFVAVATNIILE